MGDFKLEGLYVVFAMCVSCSLVSFVILQFCEDVGVFGAVVYIDGEEGGVAKINCFVGVDGVEDGEEGVEGVLGFVGVVNGVEYGVSICFVGVGNEGAGLGFVGVSCIVGVLISVVLGIIGVMCSEVGVVGVDIEVG